MLRLRVDGCDGLFEVEVPQVVVEALDDEPAEEEDDEERAHHEEYDHLQRDKEYLYRARHVGRRFARSYVCREKMKWHNVFGIS